MNFSSFFNEPFTQTDKTKLLHKGNSYFNFSGYDYHRLSWEPSLWKAMEDSAKQYGLNTGGARTTTGTHPLHLELEQAIARFCRTTFAVYFNSGYLANLAVLQALNSDKFRIIFDENAHPSIRDAVKLSHPDSLWYRHADSEDLRRILKHQKKCKQPVIITEGIADIFGTVTELRALADLTAEYEGLLLIDEAHTLGVLGESGRGAAEKAGLIPGEYIISGTLGKAFGVFGGFVSGPAWLESLLRSTMVHRGSSAPPIPVAAAARESIRILSTEISRIHRLQTVSLHFKTWLNESTAIYPLAETPVVAVIAKTVAERQHIFESLLYESIYPSFIHYPGGPGDGYFRLSLSSAHRDDEIERLKNAFLRF